MKVLDLSVHGALRVAVNLQLCTGKRQTKLKRSEAQPITAGSENYYIR